MPQNYKTKIWRLKFYPQFRAPQFKTFSHLFRPRLGLFHFLNSPYKSFFASLQGNKCSSSVWGYEGKIKLVKQILLKQSKLGAQNMCTGLLKEASWEGFVWVLYNLTSIWVLRNSFPGLNFVFIFFALFWCKKGKSRWKIIPRLRSKMNGNWPGMNQYHKVAKIELCKHPFSKNHDIWFIHHGIWLWGRGRREKR